MKTIEERAKEYSDRHKSIESSYFFKGYNYNIAEKYDAEKFAYEAGAYDQKAIDDELCAGVWVKIDADHPLPYNQEVIGYNKEWVHEDFNPSGTRVGFLNDIGFISAKWVNDQDCYGTCSEEGDDYNIYEILPDGTRKTWCKDENGEAVEGYLPNMPTHFMLIPKTPDGFAWPYNKEKEIK